MITCWLTHEGDWKSITANERIPWKGGSRRLLGSRDVCRWWQNELALITAPCFALAAFPAGSSKTRTFFTLFATIDRMHRPQ